VADVLANACRGGRAGIVASVSPDQAGSIGSGI
jgi:hypothetical protein